MDFYAGKISSNPQVSLLNDIAQIETTLGDPGARPRRPLPDPKDTHRSTHTQMALFGPTIPRYEAYNPAIAPGQSEHEYHQAFSEIISGGSQTRSGSRQGVQSGSRRSSPHRR